MRQNFFWRSDGFKTLTAMAEATATDPDLAGFTEYCRLRERGLRPEAMASMAKFIQEAVRWPLAKKQGFIDLVMSMHAKEADMVTPKPLVEGLLLPGLQQWMADAPRDAVPRRWLGILLQRADLLEEALKLDSQDQIARRVLIDYITTDADYAVHELPCGYLGNPSEDFAALDRASELAAGMGDSVSRDYYTADIASTRELIVSYKAYRDSGTSESFGEWAARNGRRSK